MRGDSGGDIREYWGLRPQYWLIGPPRIPPQDSQVSLSTPGLFHTLDIYTLPCVLLVFLMIRPGTAHLEACWEFLFCLVNREVIRMGGGLRPPPMVSMV